MKNSKIKIILVIILIMTFGLFEYKVINEEAVFYSNRKKESIENTKLYYEDGLNIVEQPFEAENNNLSYISIGFCKSSLEEDVNKIINIKLEDMEDNTTIINKDINYKNLQYKTIYKLKFNKQKYSEGRKYKLSIKYDEKGDYLPNILQQQENIENKLVFKEMYLDESAFIVISIFMIFIELIVLLISFYIIDKKDIKEEKLFLLVVPFFCILMALTIPIGQSHDESVHFAREYDISNGRFISIDNRAQLPSIFKEIFSKIPIKNNPYIDILSYLKSTIDNNSTMEFRIETDAVYNPVQFASTVIGIKFARIITSNPILIMYMGRISNIIISIIMIYYAIKLMPFGKKLILISSFIPIAIEGFATLSTDGLTISICYLFIAYILNLAFNPDIKLINKKQKITITIMASILACCKLVYLPIVLLLLIIPKDKFNGTKNKVKDNILMIIIPTIINIIWLVFSLSIVSSRSGESSQHIITALKNPINFFQMVIYTINESCNSYLLTTFGDGLEWNEVIKIPFVSIVLFSLNIIIILMDNSIKDKLNRFQKNIIIMILILIIGLIFCSLYTQWTYSESISIQGIQGRYFIPILPLIAIVLGDIRIKSEYSDMDLSKVIAISGLIILVYSIISILVYHI